MCPLNSQKGKIISYKDYLQRSIQRSENNLKDCEFGSEKYLIIETYIKYCRIILQKKPVKKRKLNRANDNLCSSDDFDEFVNGG